MATAAFWRERRVFLTGHTSFKGAWLSVMLELLNARVTGYAHRRASPDSLFKIARTGEALCDVRGCINDAAFLDGALRAAEPDIVIHLPSSADQGGYSALLEAAQNCPSVQAILILNEDAPGVLSSPLALSGNDFFAPDGPALALTQGGVPIGSGDGSQDDQIARAASAFSKGVIYYAQTPRNRAAYAHPLDCLHACLSLAEQLCAEDASSFSKIRFASFKQYSLANLLDSFAAVWGEGASWRTDEACAIGAQPCERAQDDYESFDWAPLFDLDETMEWTALWRKSLYRGQDMAAFTRAQAETYLGLRLQFAPPQRYIAQTPFAGPAIARRA